MNIEVCCDKYKFHRYASQTNNVKYPHLKALKLNLRNLLLHKKNLVLTRYNLRFLPGTTSIFSFVLRASLYILSMHFDGEMLLTQFPWD